MIQILNKQCLLCFYIEMKPNWVVRLKSVYEATADFIMDTIYVVPWLMVVPLFWLSPSPGKPKGYDGCTYWEDCLKEIERFRELSSPNQEKDKDRATSE